MEISNRDIQRVYSSVNNLLGDFVGISLPDPSEWDKKIASDKVLEMINKLSLDIKMNKQSSKIRIDAKENHLYTQKSTLTDDIKTINKRIHQKEQLLQMIKTEISDVELQSREDFRQYQLNLKPKQRILDRSRLREKCRKSIH